MSTKSAVGLSARIDSALAEVVRLKAVVKHEMSGEEHDAENALWLWRYSRPHEFEARVDELLKEVRASKRTLAR